MRAGSGFVVTGLVAAVVLTQGCAKAPQKEIDSAKAAIEAAKSAEAPIYAAEQYAAAEKALNDALAEVAKQSAASPITRNYATAKKMLAAAADKARGLAENAAAAKAAVKTEVEGLLVSAKSTIERVKAMLAKASKTIRDIKTLKGELSSAESTVASAKAMIEAGSYIEARGALISAMSQAQNVEHRLRPPARKKKR